MQADECEEEEGTLMLYLRAGCLASGSRKHLWLLGLVSVGVVLGAAQLTVLAATDGSACLACHPSPGLLKRFLSGSPMDGKSEMEHFLGSAHNRLSCVSCHPGTQVGLHKSVPTTLECLHCHSFEASSRRKRAAATVDQLHSRSSPLSPDCETCHGHHGIARSDDPEAPTHWSNVPGLCTRCHANPDLQKKAPQVADYLSSVHGRWALTVEASRRPAVCTDCHTVHATRPDIEATIVRSRFELPGTCGRCHPEEAKDYSGSVHGQALAAGNKDAPVCTSCHGEHTIQAVDDPGSSVFPTAVPETCSQCHAAEGIASEYGLSADKLKTYRESYHGIANEYGSTVVANCASCHGFHDIRPSTDPKSSINRANIPKTCGKCHPGASENFAKGKIHVVIGKRENASLYYVSVGFKWFTILIMAALVGHIVLDVWRRFSGGRK